MQLMYSRDVFHRRGHTLASDCIALGIEDLDDSVLQQGDGWRILIIWECALRGAGMPNFDNVLSRVEGFLTGKRLMVEVTGT